MRHKNLIPTRPASRRRGVTLVEMLVTVAMLVIIMTVLVQVFQAATGALSSAQALQQIDDQFRRVDSLIRSDLEGVTAHFTPPLDPKENFGYFEYGENEFADMQGEDCDDFIKFTAKAPEGKPFTGRMWVGGAFAGNIAAGTLVGNNSSVQPVTITSDTAEIIYFLRNGNLYRRVLLVAPQLQSSITQSIGNHFYYQQNLNTFLPQPGFGAASAVSWQGMNDISARPAARGAPYKMSNPPAATSVTAPINTITLNTLADLTNRENRFASPRFSDDFQSVTPNFTQSTTNPAAVLFALGPDGIADDYNSDNVPDYYPTIYAGVTAAQDVKGNTIQLIYEPFYGSVQRPALGLMGFPFIYPGAYSVAQAVSSSRTGWIHAPSPMANVLQASGNASATQFDTSPLPYLQNMNHNPIDLGDNLPNPDSPSGGNTTTSQVYQTWWGFPTWRETISPSWLDPTWQVNDNVNSNLYPAVSNYSFTNFSQPPGLVPRFPNNSGNTASGLDGASDDGNLLPPMAQPSKNWPGGDVFSFMRQISQPYSDRLGDASTFMGGATVTQFNMWQSSWEDDLIMTGVRSFDVKAYDNSSAGYVDLGWGDDLRIQQQSALTTAPYLLGNYDDVTGKINYPAYKYASGGTWNLLTQTFAHEGRVPPLIEDNILDAQYPNPTYNTANFQFQFPNYPNYTSNIGDDNPGVIRLRRVWDSWSTDYTQRACQRGL